MGPHGRLVRPAGFTDDLVVASLCEAGRVIARMQKSNSIHTIREQSRLGEK
jgi:hypothetical protein